MIEVITSAEASALTTVTRARAILGFPASDDAAAQVLIAQASSIIVDYCRRPFALETVRETFDGYDLDLNGPMLARAPVVEVLSVVEGTTVLPAESFRVDDRTGRLLRLDATGRRVPFAMFSGAITYRAGYVLPKDGSGEPAATLPEAVERAAIVLVSSYLDGRLRDASVKTETVEGVGSTSWWVPGTNNRLISPEAEQLLAPYLRLYP